MKKKFSKILGVGLTLALLISLLLTAVPVMATIGGVTLAVSPTTISVPANYTMTFNLGAPLTATGTITATFPTGAVITSIDDADVTLSGANNVAVITGNAAVVGTGTAFTAAMVGKKIEFDGTAGTWYTIATWTSATAITISPVSAITDTNASFVVADVLIAATSGIGTTAFAMTEAASVTTLQALAVTTGTAIGTGALVQVVVAGAVNPGTVASYTLNVFTSAETTAVPAVYTTTAPVILPLPGVVERYNSVGVLMEQTNSIATAVTNAADGDSIMVGAGTYDEDADIVITKSITITGDAATTIIEDVNGTGGGGTVTISFEQTALLAGVVFDGFTVMGNLTPASAITITGIGVTVQNSIFTKAGTATTAVAQDMIEVNPSSSLTTTYPNVITNNTFDTTLGATYDDGVMVYNGTITISGNTFIMGGSIVTDDFDRGVVLEAGSTPLLAVTVKDNDFSGNGTKAVGGGSGAEGTGTISGNTIDGMDQAIESDAALLTLTIKDNVIKNSQNTTGGTIDLGDAAAATITNNTFIDNLGYVLEVGPGGATAIKMLFNDMSGSAKMVLNNHTSETVDASHNYWDVAPTADGTRITYLPVLAASPSEGALAVGLAAVIAKATVGVDVTATGTAVPAIIGVANYSANPEDATPLPALAGGFYDVFLAETAPGDTTSVLVKFYNANISADTTIYVWGTIAGGWVAVTGATGVNLYEGFAFVTITATTTPSIASLGGTPFVLVDAPVATVLDEPLIVAPKGGADDISLTPTFAWSGVAGADGYAFEFSDNAYFVAPLAEMFGDSRLIVTAYAYVVELDYSTAYYWRVKAVNGSFTDVPYELDYYDEESPWVSSVFITMDEPVEPTDIILEPADIILEQPDIVIEIPNIIVPLPAETPITPSWIYVIIGVGAVLVIALIVLIVRTRRVA